MALHYGEPDAYENLEPWILTDALGLDLVDLHLKSLERLGSVDDFLQLLEALWLPAPPQITPALRREDRPDRLRG